MCIAIEANIKAGIFKDIYKPFGTLLSERNWEMDGWMDGLLVGCNGPDYWSAGPYTHINIQAPASENRKASLIIQASSC